mmetsp:Transcript_9497/g.17797  ORF Transcript_9497/g.17797 Transcript_9497/m.17797 type:complete len:428 (-) Transcript_9497:693-1976(-)
MINQQIFIHSNSLGKQDVKLPRLIASGHHRRRRVRVALVLGHELEALWQRAQQAPRNLHPVLRVRAAQQSLQVLSAAVAGRLLEEALGRAFKQAHWHITVRKGQPLQQKAARIVNALCVATPVLQPICAEVLVDVKTFRRGDVPVPVFVDLSRQPGFDDGAAPQHGAVGQSGAELVLLAILTVLTQQVAVAGPIFIGKNITIPYYGDKGEGGVLCTGRLQHVFPIRQARVALQSTTPVNEDGAQAASLLETNLLELRDQLVRIGRLIVPAGANLDGDTLGGHLVAHSLDHLAQLGGTSHQLAARTAITDDIDWAATVQIDEVCSNFVLQHTSKSMHLVRLCACNLHAEAGFRLVLAQQCPLRGLSGLQVAHHRHLAARDVRAVVLHHAAPRKVAYCGQRRNVYFIRKVDQLHWFIRKRCRIELSWSA